MGKGSFELNTKEPEKVGIPIGSFQSGGYFKHPDWEDTIRLAEVNTDVIKTGEGCIGILENGYGLLAFQGSELVMPCTQNGNIIPIEMEALWSEATDDDIDNWVEIEGMGYYQIKSIGNRKIKVCPVGINNIPKQERANTVVLDMPVNVRPVNLKLKAELIYEMKKED